MLSASEVLRIKAELGYNLLSYGQIYISIAAIFETVIQPYLQPSALSSCTTLVAAATPGTDPAPVALTLLTPFTVNVFDRVNVDVGTRAESVIVASVSGAQIIVQLSKDHGPLAYPVSLDGGESIVREKLARIRAIRERMENTFGEGPVKQVDELQFYRAGYEGSTQFGVLGSELMYYRRELAAHIGAPCGWDYVGGGTSGCALY